MRITRAGNFKLCKLLRSVALCAVALPLSANFARGETWMWSGGTSTNWDCGALLFFCWGSTERAGIVSHVPPSWVDTVAQAGGGDTLTIPHGYTAEVSSLQFLESEMYLDGKLDSRGTVIIGGDGDDRVGRWSAPLFYQRTSNSHLIARGLLVTSSNPQKPLTEAQLHFQEGLMEVTDVTIGDKGRGFMAQRGGTADFAGTLILGKTVEGSNRGIGTYEMTAGSLKANIQYVGRDGTGSFIHSAGSNVVADTLALGTAASGRGSYELSGASATVRAGTQILGYDGFGSFIQSAGSNTTDGSMYAGVNPGSSGSYAQNGGSNIVRDSLILAYNVGSSGRYTMSGGTLAVTGPLYVAHGGAGVFVLNGGQMLANNIVTGTGTSYFDINGGSFTSNPAAPVPADNIRQRIAVTYLTVGAAAGSNGTLDLNGVVKTGDTRVGLTGRGVIQHGGGQHTIASLLQLGGETTGDGTYNLSDGALAASRQYIGWEGSGSFNQFAGANTVSDTLALGVGNTGRGNYNLYAGTLKAHTVIVGYAGTGDLRQLGGSASVADTLHLGVLTSSSGSYTQSGGVHSVSTLNLGKGGIGSYVLDGGTFNVGNIIAGNGKGSAGRGSLVLNGGVFNLTDPSAVDLYGLTLGARGEYPKFVYTLNRGQTLNVVTEAIGWAEFHQNGGTHNVESLVLVVESSGVGTYQLNGGVLNVANGISGSGSFNLYGGTAKLAGEVHLMNFNIGRLAGSGSYGSFEQKTGSTLVVENETVGIGSQGVFQQSGGEHRVANLSVLAGAGFTKSGGSLDVGENFANAGRTVFYGAGPTNLLGRTENSGVLFVQGPALAFHSTYTENGELDGGHGSLYFEDVTINSSGFWTAIPTSQFLVYGSFANGSLRGDLWNTTGAILSFNNHAERYDFEESFPPIQDFALAGADLGARPTGFDNNFAWRRLTLGSHVTLHMTDGNDTAGAALYVSELQLADGLGQLGSILSDYNIYYDPTVEANAYLFGSVFRLNGVGLLIPLSAAPAVPEPAIGTLLVVGSMAVLGMARRRRSRPLC